MSPVLTTPLPDAVSGGALSLSRSYNDYGEVESVDFTVSGNPASSWSLTRDLAGRIETKTETIDALSSFYIYTYDPNGRLRTVTRDGTLVEEYHYDENGNRISEMNQLRGINRSSTFSDEDHCITVGDDTYQYDLDGFLEEKTTSEESTTYTYSSRGELLQVVLPDNTVIEYLHDPLIRRIAKKIDGTITEKYIRQGQTRLLAVYDGNDNLLMRFEYADGRLPVAMTK